MMHAHTDAKLTTLTTREHGNRDIHIHGSMQYGLQQNLYRKNAILRFRYRSHYLSKVVLVCSRVVAVVVDVVVVVVVVVRDCSRLYRVEASAADA